MVVLHPIPLNSSHQARAALSKATGHGLAVPVSAIVLRGGKGWVDWAK